jgi:S-formylglutathione hydrolase
MKILTQHRCFGGTVRFHEHDSQQTQSRMAFSTFIPEGRVKGCLIWLSGVSCTDENFMMKAGSQQWLSKAGLMVICPDTSPRGIVVPGIQDNPHFGEGASYYVDATTEGFRDHFRMYSYITQELYQLVQTEFKVEDRISIFGHSMGGNGALVMGLREKDKFRSVSAFAPAVNPGRSPWASQALRGFLGDDQQKWKVYDTCAVLQAGHARKDEILIDQGSADELMVDRLLTSNLLDVSAQSSQKFQFRLQEGYDHSYYFVSTFIADHIRFHAERF